MSEQLLLGVRARGRPRASRTSCRRACNREALAWLARWPDWPAPALVLYGPPGCGKSHLARIWAARAAAPLARSGALPAARPETRARLRCSTPAEPARRRGRRCCSSTTGWREQRRPPAADRAPAGRRLADRACRISPRGCAPRRRSRSAPPDDALLGGAPGQAVRRPPARGRRGRDRLSAAPHGALVRRRPRAGRGARRGARCASARPVTVALARARARGTDRPASHRGRKPMDLGIAGKKALVCAASKGLGRGCALALARNGVEVTITARTASALEAGRATRSRAATGAKVTPGGRRHHHARGPRRRARRLSGSPTSWSTTPAARRPAISATGTRTTGCSACNANMITAIMLIKAVVDGMIAPRVRPHRQHHLELGQGADPAARPVQRRALRPDRLRRRPRPPDGRAQRHDQQHPARPLRHRPAALGHGVRRRRSPAARSTEIEAESTRPGPGQAVRQARGVRRALRLHLQRPGELHHRPELPDRRRPLSRDLLSDAEAQAELRVLRSRSAAGVAGRADLLVRMHLLRDLRRRRAGRGLPELRRRAGAPADPPACCAGALSGLERAPPQAIGLRSFGARASVSGAGARKWGRHEAGPTLRRGRHEAYWPTL